ncbi:N amino acid transport system protein [Hortaea werneckii]|nr:N amino acid transport system protein [Hortaea werneckii]KAI7326223.1 N amino acid transport system protein [Hortaea werneckii]
MSHQGLSGDEKPMDPLNDPKKGEKQEDEHPLEVATIHQGEAKFSKLSWQHLALCLIVEAIALGALSLPSAFATLGMVAGVILTVGMGLVAIYTSHVIGQVKLRHPHIEHYADAVRLIWGRFGYELVGAMFTVYLTLLVGSHALTGTIAFVDIISQPGICALVWSVISAIILFAVALPPTFSEFAWLGYIDFASIIAAILITIISTGVSAGSQPGGMSAVNWSAWPPEDVTFHSAFVSVTNIVFAYSFAVCQFSFMSEMHRPQDYVKSIWALGLSEIFIYTLTGALIYAFVGTDVSSPALLSAGGTVSRIAFGVALPVIFISGSINGTVVCRYVVNRIWHNSPIKYTNTFAGWLVWIIVVGICTIIGWVVAEAIPFFNDLLSIISALFISGFSYYFPALFWFGLVKEGSWRKDAKNICLSIVNAGVFLIGLCVLGCGTYAAVQDIIDQYDAGVVRTSFSCSSEAYQ